MNALHLQARWVPKAQTFRHDLDRKKGFSPEFWPNTPTIFHVQLACAIIIFFFAFEVVKISVVDQFTRAALRVAYACW